jgi:WD40 repeat protein
MWAFPNGPLRTPHPAIPQADVDQQHGRPVAPPPAVQAPVLDLGEQRADICLVLLSRKVVDVGSNDSPWVSMSVDERFLARNQGGTISVLDRQSGRSVFKKTSAGLVPDPVLNPDGSRVLIGGPTSIEVWDVMNRQKLRDLPVSASCCTWFSQDGSRLYTVGAGNSVEAWKVESGERILHLQGTGGVRNAQTSAQYDRLATFSADGAARVLSLQPRGRLLELPAEPARDGSGTPGGGWTS